MLALPGLAEAPAGLGVGELGRGCDPAGCDAVQPTTRPAAASMLTASACRGHAQYRITREPAVITRSTLGAFNRPRQRRVPHVLAVRCEASPECQGTPHTGLCAIGRAWAWCMSGRQLAAATEAGQWR